MADPSLAVQGAVVAALKAASVAGGRIYDRVPEAPEFPYVSLGTGDTVGDDNSCFAASEVTIDVDVWSRAVGWPEAKALAAEVRAALTLAPTLAGFRVSHAEFLLARFIDDPDGITRHAALQFRYLVDHPVS